MKKHHLYITITYIDSVSIFYNSLKYLHFFSIFSIISFYTFSTFQIGTNRTNNPTSSHLNPAYPNISRLIPQKLFLYHYMPNILLKYILPAIFVLLSSLFTAISIKSAPKARLNHRYGFL